MFLEQHDTKILLLFSDAIRFYVRVTGQVASY